MVYYVMTDLHLPNSFYPTTLKESNIECKTFSTCGAQLRVCEFTPS